MISARPPNVFLDGKHGVKRLIPDYRAQEQAYFRKTGIFPIMHVVVMRRDAYEANRWIARNLLEAFEQAKRACLPELFQNQTSFLPTAWGNDHFEETARAVVSATAIPGPTASRRTAARWSRSSPSATSRA